MDLKAYYQKVRELEATLPATVEVEGNDGTVVTVSAAIAAARQNCSPKVLRHKVCPNDVKEKTVCYMGETDLLLYIICAGCNKHVEVSGN